MIVSSILVTLRLSW